ncbi:MAG: ketopantoate reductase family protein [Anaerolineae bacterium]
MSDYHIVILGAGALGASYTAQFAAALGCTVELVAQGARRERLQREGIVVNDVLYHLSVRPPDEEGPPADLVLVALKHHHLAGAVHDLLHVVGEETTILSVMNGIDSEVTLGEVYGPEKVLLAVSIGIDAVRQGNRVNYTQAGKILFGRADNRQIGPRVRRVQAILDRAGIAHETPVDMLRTMWWKLMVNVGVNQASAVMRAPYGVFQSSPEAQALMEDLMRETIRLAEAEGVDLTEKDIGEWYGFMKGLSPAGKTSMLQDVEAGRKTEVEIFAGKMVELGKKHGIPTPVNQTVLRIIHVLERGG